MNLKPVLESREENKEVVTLQKCYINMCYLNFITRFTISDF